MPLIALRNISKSYGNTRALRAVTLSFQDRVTTAVVGPSGCGKTTLLQLMNGLVRPDRGTVTVYGKPIDYTRLPQLRSKIGYAVQGTGLFPHMTARENMSLLPRLQGWSGTRIFDRVSELMQLVGLEEGLADRYPFQLSGGQQQRVGLCRAMVLGPDLFLLDEPFGALDPITRHEIHGEFLKLQKLEPRTIIMVTHDIREALKLAQRMVILDKGRLVQVGTCRQVLRKPANAFVRKLLRTQLDS